MDYLYLSSAITEGRGTETVPLWSVDILRAIGEGRRELRATVHPLGFTCLPVIREGRYGVCVHAWLPGQATADLTTLPVHAHSWDLASYVLFGRLRNDLPHVVAAQSGAADVWRVLEIRSPGDIADIIPTQRLVHCGPGESALNVRDDAYTLPAGTLPSSAADPTALTVTAALAWAVPAGAAI